MNTARSVGVKRAISDFQLESNDAGSTSSDGFFAPRCFFRASSIARTCTVLPSPMSSARQAPNPSSERNRSQPTPVSWYFRKVALKSSPETTGWSLSGPRILASISPSHLPAFTKDHCRSSASASSPSARSAGTPASNRIPSTNETPSSACRCTCFQWSSACCSFWRSTSTHWPRSRTSPSSAAISCRHSPSVNSSSPRASCTLKSSIAAAVNFFCFASPMVTPTRGRGRFFHQSGIRTNTPLSSKAGTSFRKRYAWRGVHASGW